MADVSLKNVFKIYPGDVKAVDDFNLEIKHGEFIVLVGPSGCGKSTTLRMIAGLEEISEGTVSIGDRVVNNVPPKNRDIAMVFQNYAIYPHMTVFDNMAFGLKIRKYKRDEIKKRVEEAGEILGISELLNRKPKALSGGQRQRVALGRAIVRKAEVFLFDEPLSNLDAKMRVQTRVEISQLHNRLDTTMIYVTHDQTEAMTMGDRIVVMKDGIIQQVDSPINLYDNPVNKFVAGFIGTPPMNFFEGELKSEGDAIVFTEGHFSVATPVEWKDKLSPYVGKPITLGVRPEDIGSPMAERQEDAPRITAKVDVTEPMGAETFVYMNTGNNMFIARVDAHRQMKEGDQTDLAVLMKKTHFFDKETEKVII